MLRRGVFRTWNPYPNWQLCRLTKGRAVVLAGGVGDLDLSSLIIAGGTSDEDGAAGGPGVLGGAREKNGESELESALGMLLFCNCKVDGPTVENGPTRTRNCAGEMQVDKNLIGGIYIWFVCKGLH